MVGRTLVVLVAGLLLAGCAQMGSITGGPEDKTAPRIQRVSPENGTISFLEKEIVFEFDEYIKLNNPTETIRLMPADAIVRARVDKRSLRLELDGNLRPNTTYSLTLNRAVQDFSVGNDSLMRYVFSTGNFIDSLSLQARVRDARTNQPLANLVAGLFVAGDSMLYQKPPYFTQSDKDGFIQFAFLQAGDYQLIVFDDLNRDLLPQEGEKNGFFPTWIALEQSRADTLNIRVSDGIQKPRIRTKVFESPSYLRLGATFGLDTSSIYVNGIKVENLDQWTRDSVGFFFQNEQDLQEIVVQNGALSDTLKIRTPEKERAKIPTFRSNLREGALRVRDTLRLDFTGIITELDLANCRVIAADSTPVPAVFWKSKPNQISVTIQTNGAEPVRVNLAPKALFFDGNKTNSTIDLPVVIKQDKAFGTLVLQVAQQDRNNVLELYRDKQLVRTVVLHQISDTLVRWEGLEPGTYRLAGFLDENQDGRWNQGSVFRAIQPERRLFFPDEIRIRANWDIEVEPVEKTEP